MSNSHIRQLEEKNMIAEATLSVWSDRMDLVAVANSKGEVVLYRLTWSKAWILNPIENGLTVRGITWRPDGKVIAIGYSSGCIILVNVEDKKILHSLNVEHDISCLCWVQEHGVLTNKEDSHLEENIELNNYIKDIDHSSKFIADSSLTSSLHENQTDAANCSALQSLNNFNLFFVGTHDGYIYIYIFGCLPIIVNINNYISVQCDISNIHLSENLTTIFVTFKSNVDDINIAIIDCSVFFSHRQSLYAVAAKYIKVISLINHLTSTISTIKETWENILLEMDTKLSKYASKVCECGVTADFLDLLMFGVCSNEMEEFLMHDLSKKGLEKFGQTIEMSYSNIQKLLLKYVTKFSQNITYHLSELRGMARLKLKFGILGLQEECINEAISANGSFLLKVGEIQQIINHSVVNYKAFFRWLYTAIIHLMDEQLPNEIPKMTQQDLAYITEFLQNFDYIGQKDPKKQSEFIMERVGQYLCDSPLKIQANVSNNHWISFLAENHCLQNHPIILKHEPDKSLIQQFNDLKVKICNVFKQFETELQNEFKVSKVINKIRVFQNHFDRINISENIVLFALLSSHDSIDFVRFSTIRDAIDIRKCSITFPQRMFDYNIKSDSNCNVLNFRFYSPNIISTLLKEKDSKNSSILAQIPLEHILEHLNDSCSNSCNSIDCNHIKIDALKTLKMPLVFKKIEGMLATEISVSGSRRVGLILSDNKRKIQILEMEADEDDDENTTMNNLTTKDNESILE